MANGGFADYLLYVHRQAVGALKAKPAGFTLSGVKPQVDKYSKGLPDDLPAPLRPLPFFYVSKPQPKKWPFKSDSEAKFKFDQIVGRRNGYHYDGLEHWVQIHRAAKSQ